MTLIETPTTPDQAAEAYAALGWHIVPIAPGKKYPEGLGRWQDAATDSLQAIRSWYGGRYKGYGVGIATGQASGVWVLDIDVHEADGYTALVALADEHGPIPQTVSAATPTGGSHLIFRWDPDRPVDNGHATQLPDGLDIRGEGGQILAAPTIHPNGEPYEWVHNPWDYEPAEAPDWLYDLMARPTAPISLERPATAPSADDGQDFDRELYGRYDFRELIERDGWSVHSTKADATWYTRPGKNTRDGHSAVFHEPHGPLVIFTTELPADLTTSRQGRPTSDRSGVSFSLYGYVTATRYNDDPKALGQALRQDIRERQQPVAAAQSLTALAVTETEDQTEAPTETTWTPVDLADALNQTPPKPEYLVRPDGVAFFYPGRDHVVFGPSEAGKSWVAFVAAHQTLEDPGKRVLVIDFEDDARSVIERLRNLGTPVDTILDNDRFRYVNPHEPLTDRGGRITPGMQALLELVAWEPHLVILDGVTEGMTLEGYGTLDAGDVAAWYALLSRRFRTVGACVVMIDHTAKGTTDGKPTEFGSQHKRSGISGASMFVDPVRRPGRAIAGQPVDGLLRLRLSKDRGGYLRGRFRGESPVIADIEITSYPNDEVHYRINEPDGTQGQTGDELGDKIVEYAYLMGGAPGDDGLSATAIARGIDRNPTDNGVYRRLKDFVKVGHFSVDKVGVAMLHKLTLMGVEAYKEQISALDRGAK